MSTQVDRLSDQRRHQSFASLRHPGYRAFFVGSATAMLADSIEHVISYWVVFQKFHSPALGGFAVLSHWLPFLIFSVPVGALSDRRDPRRLIQLGMLLFMFVSLAWAMLFVTDTLQMWHAMALLVIHGCAGVLWNTPAQALIHDIVAPDQLRSAVRLTATARYLGLLTGPAVGAALLLALGPSKGLFVNALLYMPLTVWLWRAPYGNRFRQGQPATRAALRFGDIVTTVRSVADNLPIVSMTLLGGAASFFVGNAYQAQMPGFAYDLGHGDPGLSYSMLLGADAAGALSAGFVLESRGLLTPAPRTACVLAMLWCWALGSFALIRVYPLALVLLFAAGFLELSFNTMAQTLVQLHAPPAIRGRVIGLFSMASLGFRTFSGLSVGLAGSMIGIHRSLTLSAAAVFVVTGVLLAVTGRTTSGFRVAGESSG
jgi:transmembrane secretion effector